LSDMPIIIGATKRDLPEAKDLNLLADELEVGDTTIIPCDPREKEDSKMLVLSLLQEIISQSMEPDDDLSLDL